MVHFNMNMGTLLLGFSSPIKCQRCNNTTSFQIREEYNKTNIMSVIPTGTDWGRTLRMCPICEDKEVLTSTPLLTSDAKQASVVQTLEGGKELMREAIKELSHEDRELIFKRLNKKKAYTLVKFLGA